MTVFCFSVLFVGMKLLVGFALLCMIIALTSASPNCNRGLKKGIYFCYDNSIPYRMQIRDDGRFEVAANSWGCDLNLKGEYSIRGSDLTLSYDNVDICPRFTSYVGDSNYNVVFEEDCTGFKGFQEEDNHRVTCSETSVYFPPHVDYVPISYESSSSVALVPCVMTFVGIVVALF